jgi:hypothetical protein
MEIISGTCVREQIQIGNPHIGVTVKEVLDEVRSDEPCASGNQHVPRLVRLAHAIFSSTSFSESRQLRGVIPNVASNELVSRTDHRGRFAAVGNSLVGTGVIAGMDLPLNSKIACAKSYHVVQPALQK